MSKASRAADAPPRIVAAAAVFAVIARAVLVMVCRRWVVGGGAQNSRNYVFIFYGGLPRDGKQKKGNCHAMLNAIRHGVTIANLQIHRKEQQCGLRNIGDWGEGLNHVGEKLALVVLSLRRFLAVSGTKKWSTKIKVPAQKKNCGNEWAGPLNGFPRKDIPSDPTLLQRHHTKELHRAQ